MSVVFLFGVLWKKTTTLAANFILSAGTILSLGTGVLYLWVFPSDKYDFWPHFLLLSFYIFIVLSFAAFIISYFDKAGALKTNNRLEFKYDGRPDKQVLWSWTALIIVMIALYILFNGH
jgi:SSS family solute:Na+ symporter